MREAEDVREAAPRLRAGGVAVRAAWAGPAAVVAVALAVRLAWVAWVTTLDPPLLLTDDAGWYDFFARSMADGHGYAYPFGEPTAFWPVGWPAVLAAAYAVTDGSVLAGRLLNVLLGAATAALVYALAVRWWGDRRQALAASGIFAVLPGAVAFTSLLLSETLFTALLMVSLTVLAWPGPGAPPGRWRALGFGAACAAAAYVRGQALLLPGVAVLWLVLGGRPWRESLRFGALALAVTVLLALPWSVRNTVRLGEPTFLSTNVGIDLWTGHHEGATGQLDFDGQSAYGEQFADLGRPESELAANREATKDAIRYALTHPVDEVRLTVAKFVWLYVDDADGLRWNEHYGDTPLFHGAWRYVVYGVVDAAYGLVGALAFGGLVAGLRRDRARFAPVALVFVYWTLVHLAFFAEPRFHVPVLPLMALLAGYSLVLLAGWYRRRRGRVSA